MTTATTTFILIIFYILLMELPFASSSSSERIIWTHQIEKSGRIGLRELRKGNGIAYDNDNKLWITMDDGSLHIITTSDAKGIINEAKESNDRIYEPDQRPEYFTECRSSISLSSSPGKDTVGIYAIIHTPISHEIEKESSSYDWNKHTFSTSPPFSKYRYRQHSVPVKRTNSEVIAVSSNGKKKWSEMIKGVAIGTPYVSKDYVFITHNTYSDDEESNKRKTVFEKAGRGYLTILRIDDGSMIYSGSYKHSFKSSETDRVYIYYAPFGPVSSYSTSDENVIYWGTSFENGEANYGHLYKYDLGESRNKQEIELILEDTQWSVNAPITIREIEGKDKSETILYVGASHNTIVALTGSEAEYRKTRYQQQFTKTLLIDSQKFQDLIPKSSLQKPVLSPDQKRVYITSDSRIYCLDSRTGRIMWETSSAFEYSDFLNNDLSEESNKDQDYYYHYYTIAASKESIFANNPIISADGSIVYAVRHNDGTIIAYDAYYGSVLWSFGCSDLQYYHGIDSVHSNCHDSVEADFAISYNDDILYYGNIFGEVVALDLSLEVSKTNVPTTSALGSSNGVEELKTQHDKKEKENTSGIQIQIPPTMLPISLPSLYPSSLPSVSSSTNPSIIPSSQPSVSPSTNPSIIPSSQPSVSPSTKPSIIPSSLPSVSSSTKPSIIPSSQPSVSSSTKPSIIPSSLPSVSSSTKPSIIPSSQPSVSPSTKPSIIPSSQPSVSSSNTPSNTLSVQPSSFPSIFPSFNPTNQASQTPSEEPSFVLSSLPSSLSSSFPSMDPTNIPTVRPTNEHSFLPTNFPSPLQNNVKHHDSLQNNQSNIGSESEIPSVAVLSEEFPSVYPSYQDTTTFPSSEIVTPLAIPNEMGSTILTSSPSITPTKIIENNVGKNFPSSSSAIADISLTYTLPSSLEVIPIETLKPTSTEKPTGIQLTSVPSTQKPTLRTTNSPSSSPSTISSHRPTYEPTSTSTKKPSIAPSKVKSISILDDSEYSSSPPISFSGQHSEKPSNPIPGQIDGEKEDGDDYFYGGFKETINLTDTLAPSSTVLTGTLSWSSDFSLDSNSTKDENMFTIKISHDVFWWTIYGILIFLALVVFIKTLIYAYSSSKKSIRTTRKQEGYDSISTHNEQYNEYYENDIREVLDKYEDDSRQCVSRKIKRKKKEKKNDRSNNKNNEKQMSDEERNMPDTRLSSLRDFYDH